MVQGSDTENLQELLDMMALKVNGQNHQGYRPSSNNYSSSNSSSEQRKFRGGDYWISAPMFMLMKDVLGETTLKKLLEK